MRHLFITLIIQNRQRLSPLLIFATESVFIAHPTTFVNAAAFYEYSNEHPSSVRPRFLLSFLHLLLSSASLQGIVSFPLPLPLALDGAKNRPGWCRKQRRLGPRGVGRCMKGKVARQFDSITQFTLELTASRWTQNIFRRSEDNMVTLLV